MVTGIVPLHQKLALSKASCTLTSGFIRREWRNLADAPDLGSGARKGVGVQIPPLAPLTRVP
jgi:hypothetical protein